MVATYGTEATNGERERQGPRADEFEDGFIENLKLGHDVRFVLAVVGGGAVRIGREVARKRLRYVETVAINCDPKVQDLEEFDRRVCLGPGSGAPADTGGSPAVGGHLARAAEPALDRIFEGATFVTVVASLGGGAGTGALPYILEAAAHASEVLSVFLVKPFACEGERRAVAERAIARLHFLDAFVEKQQRGAATLQVLDNEELARCEPKLPIARFNGRWAELVASHVERAFVIPAEAAVEAGRLAGLAEPETTVRVPPGPTPELIVPPAADDPEGLLPRMAPGDAELTFEIDPRGGPTFL